MAKSSKGPVWERDFCRRLSLWWTDDMDDDVFWRTAGSGGRATARRRKGKSTANAAGDIMAQSPSGATFLEMFCVELKRGYSKHTPFDAIDRAPKAAAQVFEQWISQAQKSADMAGALSWLIVFRRDFREAVVACPLKALEGLLRGPFDISLCSGPFCLCIINSRVTSRTEVAFFLLSDFFRVIMPADVRRLVHKYKGGEVYA